MNVLFALGLGLTLLLTGCFAKVYTLPAQTNSPQFAPLPDPDVLVGLAVSGGGSRAATFAAGALEALADIHITREGKEHSALETVTHLSSVSGGSLATAYYVVKKPLKSVPMLSEQGLSPTYRNFFSDFKAAMQMDFQTRAAVRQSGPGRRTPSADRRHPARAQRPDLDDYRRCLPGTDADHRLQHGLRPVGSHDGGNPDLGRQSAHRTTNGLPHSQTSPPEQHAETGPLSRFCRGLRRLLW